MSKLIVNQLQPYSGSLITFVDSTNVTIGGTLAVTGTGTFTGGISGTLSTAAQTNITSVGTLSSLAVSGNLTVDTNTLFVDASSDKVGVNTSSFGTFDMFKVVGSNATANDLTISGPNTSQVRIKFADPEDDGAGEVGYNHSTNAMRLVVNGAERLRIDSTGVIDVKSAGSAAAPSLILTGDTDTGFFRPASNNIGFSTAGSERMRIDSSGNVGIGTSSPQVKLDVRDLSPTDVFGAQLALRSTDTSGAIDTGGALSFNTDDGIGNDRVIANIRGFKENSTVGNYAGYLSFLTRANGASPTERMRIDSSGTILTRTTTNNLITALKGTGFGYSAATYPVLMVGGTGSQTVSLNYDPINNPSGAFQGSGSEVLFRNYTLFKSPNTADDGFHDYFTLQDGNVKFANGSGIDFSASAGGGATSSLLDDYEEGTWVPSLEGRNTPGTYEMESYKASYIKIGKHVTVYVDILLASVITGGGNGYARIRNLPYSIDNANMEPVGNVVFNGVSFAGDYVQAARPTSTDIFFLEIVSNTGTSEIQIGSFSASDRVQVSMNYISQ